MPKEADFNANNVNSGRVSVFYDENVTRGTHGAIDFLGNVLEWTTTPRTEINSLCVKGGSWKSNRNDCKTENRREGRNSENTFDDVGFRVVKLEGKKELERKLELASLSWPEAKVIKEGDKLALSLNEIAKSEDKKIL